MSKPDRQIEHHAHHRSGNSGEGGLQPLVAGHGLNERCAGENEEEAGQKRHVGGKQGSNDASRQRVEPAGQVPGRQKSRVLGHHDQGTGSGFGQPKPDQHLSRGEPSAGDSHIGDVAQHGVGTTEGDEGGPGEEKAELGQGVAATAPDPDASHYHRPKREADEKHANHMTKGRANAAAVIGFLLDAALAGLRIEPALAEHLGQTALQEQSADGSTGNDIGKWHPKKIDGYEGQGSKAV